MHFKVPIIVLLAMSALTLGSLSYIRAGSKPAVPTSEELVVLRCWWNCLRRRAAPTALQPTLCLKGSIGPSL